MKERKKRSMAEERASLPIYPYRQQLLEAVAEEQVCVCFHVCIHIYACMCDRSMAEERISSIIYPYRQQLLEAVAEEQVCVCIYLCVCVYMYV